MTLQEWIDQAKLGSREWGCNAELHPDSTPERTGVFLDFKTPNRGLLRSLSDYHVTRCHGCLVWLEPRPKEGEPTVFEIRGVKILPYDVLQVQYEGEPWYDYATIRTYEEAGWAYARAFGSHDPQFRIVRGGRKEVVLDSKVNREAAAKSN